MLTHTHAHTHTTTHTHTALSSRTQRVQGLQLEPVSGLLRQLNVSKPDVAGAKEVVLLQRVVVPHCHLQRLGAHRFDRHWIHEL